MSEVKLKYLGVSAFQLTTESGTRVLIDPYISESDQCPITLEELESPDLMIVTHAARDHMGDALEIARKCDCPVWSDNAVITHLLRNGISAERAKGMAYGYVRRFKGIAVRAVQAWHASILRTVEPPLYGNPVGFIIYTEDDLRLYHLGDTAIFGDMKMIAELYKPQIGMVCVGAFKGAEAEMSPDEGAIACRWLGLKMAIPMHYVMESKEPYFFAKFVEKESPATRVKVMLPGDELRLSPADFR
ncbi:MAG: metal-dependent hydrolase [Chloroflexi bacterium]|nr:metal-dependent hydrolase [Chloroflexota bacterium]